MGESRACDHICTTGSAVVGASDGFVPFQRGRGEFCPEPTQDALDPLETSSPQMNPAPPIGTRCRLGILP